VVNQLEFVSDLSSVVWARAIRAVCFNRTAMRADGDYLDFLVDSKCSKKSRNSLSLSICAVQFMLRSRVHVPFFPYVDTPLRSVLDHLQLIETTSVAGRSKGPSNEAADEDKTEAYPLGYVEDFIESRTKLVGLFSALRGGEYGWP
jgi:hypothetical protein